MGPGGLWVERLGATGPLGVRSDAAYGFTSRAHRKPPAGLGSPASCPPAAMTGEILRGAMSPENVVRLPVRIVGRLPRRRKLDEQILFRVPRLVWWISALMLRLPYGSFARRRALL